MNKIWFICRNINIRNNRNKYDSYLIHFVSGIINWLLPFGLLIRYSSNIHPKSLKKKNSEAYIKASIFNGIDIEENKWSFSKGSGQRKWIGSNQIRSRIMWNVKPASIPKEISLIFLSFLIS